MALYIKAFSLVVKTASKPLAKRLKIAISDSPSLRAWAIDAARAASRLSAFILRDESAEAASGAAGRKARQETKRALAKASMSEEAALQAASEFVGEAFVFAVAGGLVWWGGEKSNAKDEKRRADAAAERAQLCAVIDAQHSTMSDMAALVEELMRYREESRARIAALQTARR